MPGCRHGFSDFATVVQCAEGQTAVVAALLGEERQGGPGRPLRHVAEAAEVVDVVHGPPQIRFFSPPKASEPTLLMLRRPPQLLIILRQVSI